MPTGYTSVAAFCLASVLSAAPSAFGRPVYVTPSSAVEGCFSKTDLLELMNAGRIVADKSAQKSLDSVAALLRKRLAEGRCFEASPGSMVAISDPSTQPIQDLGSGVMKAFFLGGASFYSPVWSWHYAGEIPGITR